MDFAKEYWEEFEKLSIDLLKSYFKDIDKSKISVRRTQSRKDGGYDGMIIISDSPNKVTQRILSESKLRAITSKDLPMSDFSKTLVIAINMAAHELYIFTNLHFSHETQDRISKFSNMTNIKVNLMDIFHVTDELKKLPFDVKKHYSEKLLKGLADSRKEHPLNRRTDFEIQSNTKQLIPLTGIRRSILLKQTISFMEQNAGIFIVSGSQGSGKTLFIEHLSSSLYANKPYLSTDIDMIRFSNINDFFIMLLSIIWNIDVLDISKFSKEDIEEITCYIPDVDMSKEAKNVLFDVITSQAESSFPSTDIMYNCLMEYLHKVYVPILRFQKQILVFHNIEYATNLAKDILLMFLKRFYNDNIIIILEARNEITHTQKFIERCKQEVPIADEIQIPDFDDTEALLYLKSKYSSSYSLNELHMIKKICPNNPLLIDQSIKLFSDGTLHHHLLDDSLESINKLYRNPNYLKKIFSQYVNHIMCACNEETQKCAASIAFMDGKLEIKYISKLCHNYKDIINQLLQIGLFIYNDTTIEIYHPSILKPLEEMFYINNNLARIDVFRQLYYIIDYIDLLPRKKEIKKLCLSLELNEKTYVNANWEIVCEHLIREEDYEIALELLKKSYEVIHNELSSTKLFSIQLYIFQCYLSENVYNPDEMTEYIYNLDALISNKKSEISKAKIEDYLFFKAKYYLATGKYDELIECATQHDDRSPKLYCIWALGIKHKYGIDECLKSLEKGIKCYPDYQYMRYSYYDHMLSKAFKCDLTKTKECIENMKPYIDMLSLEDRIHYKYNEQCVLFYNNELDDLNELTALMRIAFQNNLSVEQSRICNLAGQFFWFKKEIDQAIEYFDEAAKLQSYTNHQTYWWIAKTNLALIYYELGKKQECINTINEIFEIYQAKNWNGIRYFFTQKVLSEEIIIFDKEIVSVLLLLSLLYKVDSKSAQNVIKELFPDEDTLSRMKWVTGEYLLSEFCNKLKDTSYYFANHYMIKC